MEPSKQRRGGCLLLLAALLAAAAQARPMPKLAEPDYTLYHTKSVAAPQPQPHPFAFSGTA